MRKGLLAQWRRGIATRGLAAAAMLAVPVAVAATIGFGSSLSGVTDGLSALASGPDATEGDDAEPPKLDSAISALGTATSSGGGAGGGATPAPGADGGGGDAGRVEGSAPAPQEGSAPSSDSGSGGGAGAIDSPEVNVPNADDGVGNTVGGLLDGVGDTVDGVLGN